MSAGKKRRANQTIRKTLRYYGAIFPGASSQLVLSELLAEAYERRETVRDQAEVIGAGDDDEVEGQRMLRFLLSCRHDEGFVHSALVRLSPGKAQDVVHWDESKRELELDSLTPLERKEFVQGTLYFGVWGNHLVVSPSRGADAADLQVHLNWLLGRECCDLLPPGASLLLCHVPPGNIRDRIQGTKKLTLNASLPLAEASQPVGQPAKLRGKITRFLQELSDGNNWFPRVAVTEASASHGLNVCITVSAKSSRREDELAALDLLAQAVTHDGSLRYQLETKNGKRLSPDKLSVIGYCNIKLVGSRLDAGSLVAEMRRWLTERISEHGDWM